MIVKRPPGEGSKPKLTPEEFINGAPDAGAGASPAEKPKAKHVKKGNKIQITHTIQLDLLERVDATFPKMGMSSRASYINMAITQMLERGVSFDGQKDE